MRCLLDRESIATPTLLFEGRKPWGRLREDLPVEIPLRVQENFHLSLCWALVSHTHTRFDIGVLCLRNRF